MSHTIIVDNISKHSAWVSQTKFEKNVATRESKWIKFSIISIALIFFVLFYQQSD